MRDYSILSCETIVSSHISVSTWVKNTFRAFLYRFADMTSLNETSSLDDFPCRAIVLCH
ncbi:hypothetical protein PGTDC60_0588 [Porphyromonas gingivalis TDC60]|nr:hypothetical protein PGTDC60_0588 [Porphyromonas gingivalis TDC60]